MSMAQEQIRPHASSRVQNMLDHVDYRLATTEAEKQEIYHLRYRAYLKEGAIKPNPLEVTTDRFDDMPNSWIFGVYYRGQLASSLRISVASPDSPETPSLGVFPELMKKELDNGKVIVDPTRFVAEPSLANRWVELPYMTLRLAYVACEYFQADLGFASVRIEHQAFYRRVMMHTIAPARDYPGLIKPISLMAIDFPAMRDKLFARYPFLRSSPSEQNRLFERFDADFESHELSRVTIVPHG